LELGVAPGDCMKNFQEQSRHCFKPPPMRFHDELSHFGHPIFGHTIFGRA
jgi:hypothetical protein